MTTAPDPSGIVRMLSDVTSALGSVRAADADPEASPVEGTGEALDGLIVATAAAPGRVTSLTFGPTAMRLDSATLAGETMAAVNAALADLQSRATAAAGAGTTDFTALSEQLKDIQDSASRRLTAFTDALVEAQGRIADRGGR
ncbi:MULTISPECIES: YbaB/EbfC family nucleoid-associated protein [Catenuloplanes]|uniref:DNA-binding protein YbaB n=1 Tax=Catenuloplanes niger TaxID=587534 RepID=A0AAE3ZYK8_9ACTN|nr:YbaB/EbfC family nucleoid-associated protein [Catenuloplanes niger]MDR7328306.1 DNA-binding protein YbaB [Catenuloplanes niger]